MLKYHPHGMKYSLIRCHLRPVILNLDIQEVLKQPFIDHVLKFIPHAY